MFRDALTKPSCQSLRKSMNAFPPPPEHALLTHQLPNGVLLFFLQYTRPDARSIRHKNYSKRSNTTSRLLVCPLYSVQQPRMTDYNRACRLTGAATFTGLGLYAMRQAQIQGAFQRVRPKGSPVIGGQVTAVIGLGTSTLV